MEESSEMEKGDDIMLPGFRFYPTDEELVGFYLQKKIQQKPLSIELIRQLDIYKYDPWDLPKLATAGEKEWYFYCPRDRKYRNSTRPNRVTRAGFWKATGTDRPIYSSEGTKCIGLKKSLVFYKGRAAKGVKTEWMMHEFRLPSQTDSSQLSKRPFVKNIPPNDSWAICRIFQKSISVANRAFSHSWVTAEADLSYATNQAGPPPPSLPSGNLSCIITDTEPATVSGATTEFSYKNTNSNTDVNYPTLDSNNSRLSGITDKMPANAGPSIAGGRFIFSPADQPNNLACMWNIDFSQQLTVDFPVEIPGSFRNTNEEEDTARNSNNITGSNNHLGMNTMGRQMTNFPFTLPVNLAGEWKPSMQWDSSLAACTTEMSAAFSM